MSLRLFLAAVLLPFAFWTGPAISQDSLISSARASLYTNRENSIRMMEDAVAQHPDRVDYRVELIRYLDVDDADFYANLVSLIALRDHPDSGELLVARIELLNEEAAEILPQLEMNAGYEEQAREIEQMLSLGMRLPNKMGRGDYERYVWRLHDADLLNEANPILDRGLKEFPDHRPLIWERAILLAKDGQFNEALALQIQHNLPHPKIQQTEPWLNWGLGDLCLAMDKPEMAVRTFRFDNIVQMDERLKLVLFASQKLTNHPDRAAEMLTLCESESARLVEIGVHLKMKDEAAARESLSSWLECIVDAKAQFEEDSADPMNWKLTQSSNFHGIKGTFSYGNEEPERWPPSLVPIMSTARSYVQQYFREHEDEPNHLEWIAKWTRVPDVQPRPPVELLTFKEKIEHIKAELEKAEPREKQVLLHQLAHAYGGSGFGNYFKKGGGVQFNKAAQTMADVTLANNSLAYGLRTHSSAVRWSVFKRKGQAMAYFLQHPEKLARVRRSLDSSSNLPFNRQDIREFGPEVLAFVFDALNINTISGEDRSELVKVVEQLGSKEDIPVLLDILGMIVHRQVESRERLRRSWRNSQRKKPFEERGSSADEEAWLARSTQGKFSQADRNSVKAIHIALEKLTGIENEEQELAARVNFWREWWKKNATQIVTEDQ